VSLLSRIIVVTLLACLAFWIDAWSEEHPMHGELAELRDARDVAQARVDDRRVANLRLIREIEAMTHDSLTIERRAREELSYVRPDEIILVFPSEDTHGERADAVYASHQRDRR